MGHEGIHPTGEMILAADGLVDACGTMLGLTLQREENWHAFSPEGLAYGGSIHLIYDEGCWEVGLFGDRETCASMAAVMLAMEAGEQPAAEEIVDALGEIVNIVVGMLKTKIGGSDHGDAQIGVPLFLLEEDCLKHVRRAIPMHALSLRSPDFEGQLLFVWSERNRQTLIAEISAWLETADPDDKKGVGHIRGLFDELHEGLGSDLDESIWLAVDQSAGLLARVINDEAGDGARVFEVLRETTNDLREALQVGAVGVQVRSPLDVLAGAPQVARDDETTTMLREFLEEAEEGLDRADEVLIDAEQGQVKDESVHALFRVFHSIKGVAGFLELEDVATLGHHTEHLLSEIREGRQRFDEQNLDLVFESTGAMRGLMSAAASAMEKGVGFERHDHVAKLIEKLERAIRGERVASSGRSSSRVADAPVASPKREKVAANVRVESALVERLHGAIDELRRLEPRLMVALGERDESLHRDVSEHLSTLLEVSMLMKMTSLESLFQKMARMVRDLSKKTEKLAQLVTTAAHTKIERSIAERVSEPLVHMIRNAVDHGLEDEIGRRAAGKPLLGTVYLEAERRETEVIIRIRDDGKGLDREAILHKARSRGLIAPDARPQDADVFQLIFEPGFSTAPVVTAISGRGVGMDVVRRSIEGIGGRIDVSSEVGVGTSFELVLPSEPAGRVPSQPVRKAG